MDDQKDFLATAPVGKLLFKLALPTVTAQIINMLYNIVDRIYIGHIPDIGADALTGVGVCMPLIMIVSAFAALVGYGGAPRASISMGTGNNRSAEKTLGNCFTALLLISAILTAVLLVFNRTFLMAFGASENTIRYAVDYMNIYAAGTVFVQITLGMNMFITAQGFAKTGMLSVLIGAAANIILDPIFIFGLNMGVQGAALATVLSQAMSCAWVLAFLFGKKNAPENQKRKPAAEKQSDFAEPCAGPFHFYYAGKRKRDLGLLQRVAAALRRRHGGGRHDDFNKRYAVRHAAAAGAWPGCAAHHQLQLRRRQYRAC